MSEPARVAAVVLAAGQGTRMKSARAKVLHEVADRPMLAWSVAAALEAGVERAVVVVGHDREAVEADVRARYAPDRVTTAVQPEQRGTGDAVRCGLTALEGFEGRVLITYGDCPLARAETLHALIAAGAAGKEPLAMLTGTLDDPTGYGRIIRDHSGNVIAIREHRDCSPDELALREVNPGVYSIDAAFLRRALAHLGTGNAQGELYLTDVVAIAAREGGVVDVRGDMRELQGINDRWQLADADRAMRARILQSLAMSGVTVRAPETTFVGADVEIAQDVTLEPGVVLRGRCRIGAGARIDVGCVLTDVVVEAGAYLKPYTIATESRIGERAQVGPFSHLRPASDLGPDVHVGNFVETKKTSMARGSKANHLAYLGDGIVGEEVNVGAGTIFCNYDGYQKHTTILEDGAFVGSDSQLIAPVRVGKNAYVATGTTVTKDVPADGLAISRVRQQNKDGYAPRLRARLRAAQDAAKKHHG